MGAVHGDKEYEGNMGARNKSARIERGGCFWPPALALGRFGGSQAAAGLRWVPAVPTAASAPRPAPAHYNTPTP